MGHNNEKKQKKRRSIYISVGVLLVVAITAILAILAFGLPTAEEKRLHRIQSGEEGLNIILISVDTLRADYCGCYGSEELETPNIDSLASGGTMFTQCKAQVPLTLPSHTTIMTGTYPPYHGVITNSDRVPEGITTLAEVLNDAGYATGAFIGGFPLKEEFGLNQGFDIYNDDFTSVMDGAKVKLKVETPADIVWSNAFKWIGGVGESNFFLFLHLYDPHSPYAPPLPYELKYPDNLYAGEVKSVDDAIGTMLKELDAAGLRENTLIVFLSDHGEALGEHGEVEHGYFIYDEAMHVPLIFNSPGLIPVDKKVDGIVRLADVHSTILEILGLDVTPENQGESLVDNIYQKGDADREAYMESRYANSTYGWAGLYGLEKDGWKYIDAPEPELYNMKDDPDEEANLVDSEPEKAAAMAEVLAGLTTSLETVDYESNDKSNNTDSDIAALAALGYLADSDSSRKPTMRPDVDPKDKIEYHNLIIEYPRLRLIGKLDEAKTLLKQIYELEPDLAYTDKRVGIGLKAEGNLEEAGKYFELAFLKDPEDVGTMIELADIYMNTGRIEEGETILGKLANDTAAATDEDKLQAFLSLGISAKINRDDTDGAITFFKKALEVDKASTQAYYYLTVLYAEKSDSDREVKKYGTAFLELEPEGDSADYIKSIMAKIE